METVQIRNITLGAGHPKICVPLTGPALPALLEETKAAKAAGADLLEWRADYFAHVEDAGSVVKALAALRAAAGETPLLFTFRTFGEGGQKPLPKQGYAGLNASVAASGCADMIDVELFAGDDIVGEAVKIAHEHGVAVVVSNHDFEKTPPQKEMVARLCKMHALGGDIPKIAVMPKTGADVLALLAATWDVATAGPSCPVITVAMGGLGSISRVAGEFFGSCITFGAVGGASAPGQLPAQDLRAVLEILHKAR